MINIKTMPAVEQTDADLVSESLNGSRDAFRRIVERYQTLICSLAYSATGSVSRSEDMAQETFLAAWQKLRSLREPAKLKAWLCGIARHRIQKTFERDGREPAHNADPLEAAQDSSASEALPSEQAISREEEAILWRSLEKIPELYREPLILYYREHQSIEHVAVALDLTEDAVKQRLVRGRKLLQDEVQSFVEGALRRTAPGQAFSGAVLALLPLAAGPAATAGLGAGVKGSAAAKSGFLAVWLWPLVPFLGIAAGAGAQCLMIRSTTANRKERLKQNAIVIAFWVVYLGMAVGGESALRALARHFEWNDRTRFVATSGFWWFFLLVTITFLNVAVQWATARQRARIAAGEISPPPATPLKTGTLAPVVAGGYLMFSWFIHLTWSVHDLLATGIAAGAMLLLAFWSFFRLRGHSAAAIGPALGRDLSLFSLVILAILNLRMDVWVASAYGVTVAEAHNLQPIWIIPVLTLALIAWTAMVIALTKPKRVVSTTDEHR
ncbi:MAG: RNA polymerase sigma factor [Limisphaerales bacterium]